MIKMYFSLFNRMYLYKMFYIVCFITSLLYVECMFPVEEMKWMNYEVDISVIPVKKEDVTQPAVFLKSKGGQEFQCLLPQLHDEEITEKEVTSEKDLDVLSLLKPMRSSSCLLKTKDWWTYEFCFGHYIKQYHVEDGRIQGQVITLGLYDSDYDWNNETDQEKFKHVKQKYHSQYYTNGTKCDLTGQPRTTEVRFYCEEDAGDYIYRVDEPGTCSYVVMVHTSRLCSHPQLKPSPYNKAHSIPCHPVLNDEQYTKYLQKVKEESTLAEEKRNQWLSSQQERLQVLKKGNSEIDASTGADPLKMKVPKEKVVLNPKVQFQSFLLEEYLKAIETIESSPKEKLASLKKELKKKFEDIFDEAEEDFDSDFIKENKRKLFLNLLSVMPPLNPDGVNVDDLLLALEEDETKPDSETSETKPDSKTSETKPDSKTSETMKETKSKPDESKQDFQIKRYARIKDGDGIKLQEEDLDEKKKLEDTFKEKLEKLGIDTEGRRVEVKIISGGFFNADGEGKRKLFKPFSKEETEQFQDMILSIMTGQEEAVHEKERHKKLEESYQFAWSDNEEMEKKED